MIPRATSLLRGAQVVPKIKALPLIQVGTTRTSMISPASRLRSQLDDVCSSEKISANNPHNPNTKSDKDTKGEDPISWGVSRLRDENTASNPSECESDIDDGPGIAVEIATRRRVQQEQKVAARLAETQARRAADTLPSSSGAEQV